MGADLILSYSAFSLASFSTLCLPLSLAVMYLKKIENSSNNDPSITELPNTMWNEFLLFVIVLFL